MLHNTAFLTFLTICFVLFLGGYLPDMVSRSFYTLSLLIRDLVMLVLPIAIFTYIALILSSLKQQAALLVAILILFEALSNTLSIGYAYGIGSFLYQKINNISHPMQELSSLIPYFSLGSIKPQYYTADKGTFLGLITGFILASGKGNFLENSLKKLRKGIDIIFTQVFARLIPLMVLGFMLNIHKSGMLSNFVDNYGLAFLAIIAVIGAYLLLLYSIASSFKVQEIERHLKNIWPVGLIAFTSSSSAATMPFTIAALEKSVKDPAFARLIIPATTNIQQIGDCIANILFCLLILKQFGSSSPDVETWALFITVYVLARFTTAGMMGGAIFILIPLFEKYLGFTPEMSSFLLALNVLLDPVITSSNVMANGALCIIFEKLWHKITRMKFKKNKLK